MKRMIGFLSQFKLPVGALQARYEDTGIPFITLKTWRAGLQRRASVRPYSAPATISKRELNPVQEEALMQQIQSEFLDPKKLCPPQLVQTMAVQIHSEQLGKDDDRGTTDEDGLLIPRDDEEFLLPGEKRRGLFKASRHSRDRFLDRHSLSTRKPHAKRRPIVTQTDIDKHRLRLGRIPSQYLGNHLIHMDENSWKLLNCGFLTVAKQGPETVDCWFEGDPKMCLTGIIAIDADGEKFLFWVLCRGRR
jgi:hypothetical protein